MPDAKRPVIARVTSAAAAGCLAVLGALVGAPGAGAAPMFSTHEFPASFGGFSVAVGDFNADSDPDLALANGFADSVTVHLGGTGGVFGPPTVVAGGDTDPVDVAVGDFNADSDPDLAVANFTPDTVSVVLGAAGGTFGAPTAYPVGGNPAGVAVADFNADSDPDLAVSNRASDDVSILLGGAGGTFGPQADFPTGDFPLGLAVGRFDPGPDPDLATANVHSSDVSVLLGGNAGGFDAKTDFPVSASQQVSIAVGTFDPGADPDLAVGDNGGTISVLLGGAGGSFGSPTGFPSGASFAGSIAVGHVNPGSDPDLAVAGSLDEITVLTGGAGASFAAPVAFPTGLSPSGVALGDFNADSNTDIVAATQDSGTVSILVSDLIRNANAEADAGSDDGLDDVDLTSWNETGATTAIEYGAPDFPTIAQGGALGGGANFFAGGNGAATSTATQNVTMAASSLDEIDAGGVTANLNGFLGGYADQDDNAVVVASFLDGAGATLGNVRIGPVTAAHRAGATKLLYRSRAAAVPAGTRKIRVRQTFRRVSSAGPSNDGYSDNLVLTLSGL
jgi:hypothetical protein